MIKTCSFCGIVLAPNNIFDWYKQPICYECLKMFTFDEKKSSVPTSPQVTASAGSGVAKILFSLNGRISRGKLWLYEAGLFNLIYFSFLIIGYLAAGEKGIMVGLVAGLLLLFWPWIALHVKRAHDRNHSGAYVLFSFIPLVNIWFGIEAYFLRGTEGPNAYGPDPLAD